MIGASPRRKEDLRLLRGAGRFLDDVVRDGLVHLAVVRSAEAHARIRSVRTADAARLPGVVAAWSAADLPELARPLPSSARERPFARPALAREIVRYVGEPIAIVVA